MKLKCPFPDCDYETSWCVDRSVHMSIEHPIFKKKKGEEKQYD